MPKPARELAMIAAAVTAFWLWPTLWTLSAILLLAVLYPVLTRQWPVLTQLGLSGLFAIGWVAIAHDRYGYNLGYAELGGVPLFPLLVGTLGLFGVWLVFQNLLPPRLAKAGLQVRLPLFALLYWTLLLAFEASGYHWLEIHNVATGMYAGLPFCDCMHAPRWMQASYFAIGPLYYLATAWLPSQA